MVSNRSSEKFGYIEVTEYGSKVDFDYHTVYSDGKYIYDPRYSEIPILKEGYLEELKQSNGGNYRSYYRKTRIEARIMQRKSFYFKHSSEIRKNEKLAYTISKLGSFEWVRTVMYFEDDIYKSPHVARTINFNEFKCPLSTKTMKKLLFKMNTFKPL